MNKEIEKNNIDDDKNTVNTIVNKIDGEHKNKVKKMISLAKVMNGKTIEKYDECSMNEIRVYIGSVCSEKVGIKFQKSDWYEDWYIEQLFDKINNKVCEKLNIKPYFD